MRKDLRYRNYYKYKKNRKSNIRRQFCLAVAIFLMCLLIAIATIILAVSGVTDKNRFGSSVSDKSSVLDGEIMTKDYIKIDERTKIRVLIKTDNFEALFHGDVEASSDVGLIISAKNNSDSEDVTIPPMECAKMSELGQLFEKSNIVRIKTAKEDGAIYLNNVKRSCGTPAYYGEFDIYKTENGFVIVNELLLDKYIYGVVPSEMPESYGMEALKAQAVCARSYAARRLNALGYPEYEAAVDDSVRYQVYNNYEVSEAVKEAVDTTSGQLAMYNGEIIDAYFYATSCGTTAGGEVWSEESGNCPYLKCRELNEDNSPIDLSAEDSFSMYIENTDSNNFDFSSAWYRWEIDLDLSKLSSEFIDEYGNVKEIEVVKRSSGGVITNLCLNCEKKNFNLDREYDVREFFGKLISGGKNQEKDISGKTSMLPSACFYIAEKNDNKVKIKGGGYGHGVGLSQTGAKGMAERGYDYKKILTDFYPDIKIEKML